MSSIKRDRTHRDSDYLPRRSRHCGRSPDRGHQGTIRAPLHRSVPAVRLAGLAVEAGVGHPRTGRDDEPREYYPLGEPGGAPPVFAANPGDAVFQRLAGRLTPPGEKLPGVMKLRGSALSEREEAPAYPLAVSGVFGVVRHEGTLLDPALAVQFEDEQAG